jgi:hypothetical protein
LVVKPEGRTVPGGCRHIWEDIKIYLKEINCIHSRTGIVVNAVMNLQVP